MALLAVSGTPQWQWGILQESLSANRQENLLRDYRRQRYHHYRLLHHSCHSGAAAVVADVDYVHQGQHGLFY